MKTMKKIENLGVKFNETEDIRKRTSILRIMMCYFLNFVFYVALRATGCKIERSKIMSSAKPEDREMIIEEGEDYVVVEWQVSDKNDEKAKKYNVEDIYLYCTFKFKDGILKKIEVE